MAGRDVAAPAVLAESFSGSPTSARADGVARRLWIALAVLFFGEGRARSRRVARGASSSRAVSSRSFPWAVRNHSAFGKWIFSTTHGGITFYQGNNAAVLEYPQYHGGVAPLHMLPGYDELKTKPEIEKDEAARSMGREFSLRQQEARPASRVEEVRPLLAVRERLLG